MALVYRIETMTGQGPYRGHTWDGNLFPQHDDSDKHPSIWNWDEPWGGHEDWSYDMEWYMRAHVCGFLDTTQLHNWFNPEECKLLRKHKYICATYEVPDEYVEMGEHQCSFNLDFARRVKIQKIW